MRPSLLLSAVMLAAVAACGPKAPPAPPVGVSASPDVGNAEPVSPEPPPLPTISTNDLVLAAVASLQTGTEEDAKRGLEMFKDLARAEPERPEHTFNQGVALEILGDRAGARKAYLRTTDIDPEFGDAWLNMGAMSERDGELSRALQNYRAGLRNDDGNGLLVAATVGVLRKLGRYEEAERQARLAIKGDANNVDAYNALGLVYLAKGELELAQFVYQRAIMAVPGADANAQVHANLGRVFLEQGKPADARLELDKALTLDTELVDAMVALSHFHLDNRDWSSTVELLERARTLDDENPDIEINLGIGYRGLGRHDEAELAYEKALDLDPENPNPYLNLALLYGEHLQQFDKALETIQRYRDLGGTETATADAWESDIAATKKKVERQKEIQRKREERRKKQEERQRLLEEEKAAQEAASSAEPAPAPAEAAPAGPEGAPASASAGPAWGGGGAAVPSAAAPAASALGQACETSDACGGLTCASDAICREAGAAGTAGAGQACFASSDCALGLSCSGSVCAEGQEQPDAGTASPWGGQ